MDNIDVKCEGFKKLVKQIRGVIRDNGGNVNIPMISERVGISKRFTEDILWEMGFRPNHLYKV